MAPCSCGLEQEERAKSHRSGALPPPHRPESQRLNGPSAQPSHARQTGKEWADAYSSAVLARAATLIADVCRRRRIPVRWLVAGDLVAGRRGITGHSEVSAAYGKSDHWDPGPGFPVERFLDRVRRAQQAARASARA